MKYLGLIAMLSMSLTGFAADSATATDLSTVEKMFHNTTNYPSNNSSQPTVISNSDSQEHSFLDQVKENQVHHAASGQQQHS